MNLIFFIKSATVNIDKYTIKDVPGSSGRLDVISRSILAAILNRLEFERNIQIWVFLDNYGTFIFDSKSLEDSDFPRNELLLSDYFVKFLRELNFPEKIERNPLNSVKISKLRIFEAIKNFQKLNYSIYILEEKGKNFFNLIHTLQETKDLLFIIGSQKDIFLTSKDLLALKIPSLSIGNQSYLASSVIRLLKLHLIHL